MLYRRKLIPQLQQVIRPERAQLRLLTSQPCGSTVIGVHNTFVGPGVSLCCKCLSVLVHTKREIESARALTILICIRVTSGFHSGLKIARTLKNLCKSTQLATSLPITLWCQRSRPLIEWNPQGNPPQL